MDNKVEIINSLVFQGFLPIAFINSKVLEPKEEVNKYIEDVTQYKINRKYCQKNLPDACSTLLLSKIYEIY